MKIFLSFSFFLFQTSVSAAIYNCSSDQQSQIISTESAVVQKLRVIENNWESFRLDNVKKNFVLPEGRRWVNQHPRYVDYHHYWQNLGTTFTAIRSSLEEKKIHYKCHTSWKRRCNDNTIAYVLFLAGHPFKTIHICPAFFEPDNFLSRSSYLLHELSHSISKTEDYELSWSDGSYKDLKKASQDAYHIQEFQQMDTKMILFRTVWVWLFPKT